MRQVPIPLRLALAGCAVVLCVSCGTTVVYETAPPPPRYEVITAQPSSRHIWVHGHWFWRDGGWVWLPGHWIRRPHDGAVWIEARWEVRGNNYVYVQGHWH